MMNLSSLSKAKLCASVTTLFSTSELVRFIYVNGIHWEMLPSVIAVVMACSIQFYIWKLQRSLCDVQNSITSVSQGDFSVRIKNITEQGEIGDLYHNINHTIDVMDAFVREATACMQSVNNNKYYRKILPGGLKGSLLFGSNTMNKALANIGQKMSDFSRIAHDVDMSLNAVASEITQTISVLKTTTGIMENAAQMSQEKTFVALHGAEDTSHSVDTISAASEEMSVSIAEISHQIHNSSRISQQAVECAKLAKERMYELNETVQKIANVVLLIEDIAAQTNLLALNATIEAARAGEAGKGFGVVATEVKTLAAGTTSATDDIREQISAIQSAALLSMKSFEDISSTIHEMNHYISNISAAIEEQSAASNEITKSSQRAAQGTAEVSQSMSQLGSNMYEVTQSTEQVMDIANILSGRTIVNIKALVEKMNMFMNQLHKVT